MASLESKTWRIRLTRKLRFGLSESRLNEYLSDLSTCNSDFLVLSKQTIKRYYFLVATQLGKSIGSSLGCTYDRIVKKCLGCDFGEGSDLNDSKLQTVYYRDVVCELE